MIYFCSFRISHGSSNHKKTLIYMLFHKYRQFLHLLFLRDHRRTVCPWSLWHSWPVSWLLPSECRNQTSSGRLHRRLSAIVKVNSGRSNTKAEVTLCPCIPLPFQTEKDGSHISMTHAFLQIFYHIYFLFNIKNPLFFL